MPSPSKRQNSSILTQLAERSQIDFEMEFFASLLKRVPDFAEVLRAQFQVSGVQAGVRRPLLGSEPSPRGHHILPRVR